MKWFVIWICACNADLQVIYSGWTEDNARAYAAALYADPRVKGHYMIAQRSDFFTTQPTEIWPSED